MLKKRSDIIFILVITGLAWLISFPLNAWFSETMLRHQLLQLPSMLALGIIAGFWFTKNIHVSTSTGIAILIIIMASLIFWMLPHSIDDAVINAAFNRVMHINMLLAGFFAVMVLRQTLFEIKIIFLGMISSMLMATGITLNNYDLLLCSSFDIFQQHETGFRLIISGIALYVVTVITFLSGLGKSNKQKKKYYDA